MPTTILFEKRKESVGKIFDKMKLVIMIYFKRKIRINADLFSNIPNLYNLRQLLLLATIIVI